MSDEIHINAILEPEVEVERRGLDASTAKSPMSINTRKQLKLRYLRNMKSHTNAFNRSSAVAMYDTYLHSTSMIDFKEVRTKTRCPDDKFVVLKSEEYSKLFDYNYKRDQLKTMARVCNIRLQGTVPVLLARLYSHMHLSSFSTKIQALCRGHLQRVCNRLRGAGFMNREICCNGSDFLTGDDMKDIPSNQFFSYRSSDNNVYGFDVISLYNLKRTTRVDSAVKNPYTRAPIHNSVFIRLRRLIVLAKRCNNTCVEVSVKDEAMDVSAVPTVKDRVFRLFTAIDVHGHYTTMSWFTSLDKEGLIKLVRELADIWQYRASLDDATRALICPVNPFPCIKRLIMRLKSETDMEVIRGLVLGPLEAVVCTGITESYRSLGAIYVLQWFTLVDLSARTSMPCLYESVVYR